MDILEKIIPRGREDYKCYDLIKYIISTNKDYKKIIENGFILDKIKPFDEELLQKFNMLNIRWPVKDIDEVLFLGGNIGGCTTMAHQLSFIIDNSYKCAGFLPILAGTKNCNDGTHTWVESPDGWIYDTSLMLIIHKSYKNEMGYKENIREVYNKLQFYLEQKEYALDDSLRSHQKK